MSELFLATQYPQKEDSLLGLAQRRAFSRMRLEGQAFAFQVFGLATYTSATILEVGEHSGIAVSLNVSVKPATGSLYVEVHGLDPSSGTDWGNIGGALFNAATIATGVHWAGFGMGVDTTYSRVVSMYLPRKVRIVVNNTAGGGNWSAQLGYCLIP